MFNDWEHLSPGRSPSPRSYPTPVPSPDVDEKGVPLPPGAPKFHPIPLPSTGFSVPPPHLHPILGYADCPCIQYDVRKHPSYASALRARLEWAHELATSPPSSQIIITCHALPHPFVVRPSGRRYYFVTVYDILLAVHRAFNDAFRNIPSPWTSRPSGSATALLSGGQSGRPSILPGRYTWKGVSEEIAPGNWLLHIE
ncbi:hypothetical protein AX14_005220 [Amanita brunnescens Koide BX004]|nr:hypothetical protein AX14_005220 [Amanita brunnescens Koide BX004]